MDGGSQKTHWIVSTHSRPKAAGPCRIVRPRLFKRFNTQPPEGGWPVKRLHAAPRVEFQHTAARRRLGLQCHHLGFFRQFQHTAARRRLVPAPRTRGTMCSFNTQPPEGGWDTSRQNNKHYQVSTHSRPKAAGRGRLIQHPLWRGFNTQPPEGGWFRRHRHRPLRHIVSTHSRPKAAGQLVVLLCRAGYVSTHSRPKAAGNRL